MKKLQNEGVGQYAFRMIAQNPAIKNEDLLAMIKAEFPDKDTKMASVAWYKSKFKKDGMHVQAKVDTLESITAELEDARLRVAELEEKLDNFKLENEAKIEEENRRMLELLKARGVIEA